MRRIDALLVLMVVIWGVNYSIIKQAFAEIPPQPFNAMRLVLVIQGGPVPGDVALGLDGTGDGQRERQPDRRQSKRRLRK